jgi:2-(1,2-epoxy-1,2-dihydrophenyl)acetyl-CoA isomerase
MQLKTVGYAVDEGVCRITLRRPDRGNAMNPRLTKELFETVVSCEIDPSVRAVLIDAEGPMFCAGGDLGAFAHADVDLPRLLKRMTVDLPAAISRIARMEVPVIAAVQGAAAGGGFSLAAACDIVLAGHSAKFTLAYTRAGLAPDGSSTYFLPRLVGRRRALELMLLNPTLSATDALDAGLITQVVDDAELSDQACALARSLAQGPTGAFGAVKRLILASANETLESQMELEASAIIAAATSDEGREGISAFLEKRRPNFTGC